MSTSARSSRWLSAAAAWLLIAILPFQALTAVYLDMRGPLHFHVDHHDAHEHGHGQVHGQVTERHHHRHHDWTVVVIGVDGRLQAAAAESEGVSARSSAMLYAMIAGAAALHPPDPDHAYPPTVASMPASAIPRPFERPPQQRRG